MISIAAAAAVIGAHKVLSDKSECYLDEDEKREIKNTPFIWTLHHNKGMACEKLKEHSRIVKLLSAGTILGLIVCFMQEVKNKGSRASRLGLGLIIGGGIANLADRVDDGEVTDYLKVDADIPHIKDLVFNIADAAVCIGAFIYLISKICSAFKND